MRIRLKFASRFCWIVGLAPPIVPQAVTSFPGFCLPLSLSLRRSVLLSQYAAATSFASDALRPPWKEVTHRRLLTNKIIVACGRAGPDHYQQVSMGGNPTTNPVVVFRMRMYVQGVLFLLLVSISVSFSGKFFLPKAQKNVRQQQLL